MAARYAMRHANFAAAVGEAELDNYLATMEIYSGVLVEDGNEVYAEDIDRIIDAIDKFATVLIEAHADAHGCVCDCGTHERLQNIINSLDCVDAMKSNGETPARIGDELYAIIREFRFMNLRRAL
jgi:hypothetical protein